MINSKNIISLENRVLFSLLKEVEFDRPSINSFQNALLRIEEIKTNFERVDLIMSKIHIGDIFLLEAYDDFEMNWFEQKVTNIIDKELGIVECIELNTYVLLYPKERNIVDMLTEEEFNIKFSQNPKLNGIK